ncbi:kinase/pyrophosphorylase [Alkalicella caledoniensis]|uniref:Putative pyruvate, phosphate dikinase regulatory protein n=1 Tax=Alkalicella caledoniensis TaxID=2731377 RepID=A0A7G9WC16_ALKCA|nr:pyruvate, water dikinase regulatory protein [Alkalicella caledoniensis]QNO16228.1 kinase/pyrophosphorylase [Alkalicella caledoniensis]
MLDQKTCVYVLSDSLGETAELVVKAAASQYNSGHAEINRIPYVTDKETVKETIEDAEKDQAMVAFTFVIPELREYTVNLCKEKNIPFVDIMGPVMEQMARITNKKPRFEPGILRKLDTDYFKRIEAIEFAVKYDDGKDPRGLIRADVVLVGVSRTSKTPLSMYLAHKQIKAANVPLVPEVKPPKELFEIDPKKIIGLTISPHQLNEIRKERLLALGLRDHASYASMERILAELDYAEGIMRRLNCPVLDVTNKAVEETTGKMLSILREGI